MATAPEYTAPAETPFTAGPDRRSGARSYAVPFIVAVTGHRDLVPDEIPIIRSRVRDCLFSLRYEYPSRIIVVMSSLADGADRLVAEEALKLGMPLSVVLPMPRALYEEDFTAESREQFARLCDAASEIFELPLLPGSTPRSIVEPGPGRTRQYAQVGVFSERALPRAARRSGTARTANCWAARPATVRFHHHDVMPGYTPRVTSSKLNLTEDESDLVYHVVCSRDRPDGEPAAGSQAVRHVLVHDRRGQSAHRGNPGAASQGLRVHERVQPRGAEQRRGHRQGALLPADRRAGGHAAGRALGHQPGVLRGRLAGDPLPEEGRDGR